MSWKEFRSKCSEISYAINRGDYIEAVIINDAIYSREFIKYSILIQAKKQLIERKSELELKFGEVYCIKLKEINRGINIIKKSLENLSKIKIKLEDIKENA